MHKNIETFIGCDASYEDADIVLFGAPYDSTTSFRPGTRFAAKAMRSESFGLETYSPYQDRDLEDMAVFDAGDLEFAFGNSLRMVAEIEAFASEILSSGKRPCMIGGEHLVSLGAIAAAYKKHPDLCLIHFDAHADLRQDYLGEPLSHATVMRRAWEYLGDGRIFQFGIRSGCREEIYWGREHVTTHPFDLGTLPQVLTQLGDRPLYLSIDLDVLDPGVFPGTGTPEAGGVSFAQLLGALLQLKKSNIVAADICELAPIYDPTGASTAMACKVLRELLLVIGK